MFLAFVFEQTDEAVKLPSVEFLVPTLAPIPRLAVPIVSNTINIANCYLLHTFFDTLFNDVFRECGRK